MRGITQWQARPYTRLTETEKARLPYICRLVPETDGFALEWMDMGMPQAAHELLYRKYKSLKPWTRINLYQEHARVNGLEDEQDYELYIRRLDAEGQSAVRIVRTGYAPGTVVNYLHPDDPHYDCSGHALCSPSLIRLPSGRLLASMDAYAPRAAQNLTVLYASEDDGNTWRYQCDIMPCFWGKLFWHAGRLYLLGCNGEYGDLLLGCSDDEGHTWSAPIRLLPGGGMADVGPHKAPMPVIEHAGRLYTAIEYGSWQRGRFGAGLLSIDAEADLMNPDNWRVTEFVKPNPAWPGVSADAGWIEGNAVVAPDGCVCDLLRYNGKGASPLGSMAIMRADAENPEAPLQFDRVVDFNGGHTKFVVRFDAQSEQYIALANEVVDENTAQQRNVLSLSASSDLYHWRIVRRLIDYRHADPQDVAFQYPDWQFDGEDLIFLSRTALNRAKNFHDANMITFHRVNNFRELLK